MMLPDLATTRLVLSRSALALLATTLPLFAQGAWIDAKGTPQPDTESMRSAGDFGVQIVLTADEAQFRRAWNSQKTPPKLSTTNNARVGDTVSAMLVFHGCTPARTGNCDVTAEFEVDEPNGKKVAAGSGPLWSSKPMPPGMLQLGLASLAIGFDKSDAPGDYKVTAKVKDKVSGHAISVTARLNLSR